MDPKDPMVGPQRPHGGTPRTPWWAPTEVWPHSEEELTLTRENSIRRLHSSHSTDTRTQVGDGMRGAGGLQGEGKGVGTGILRVNWILGCREDGD